MVNSVIDFSKQQLPKIYKRQNKKCYLDPIREKLIFITPEETVRQQVISYLLNVLNVPAKMIDVEVHLSHYGIKSRRRVDILINKYLSQYQNIKFIHNESFHDRFIIIDKQILYNCGSSFKDLGKKCFAINKIEDLTILNNIIKEISE